MDYLKIGKATELQGRERKIYRALEMLPGILSWGTLITLALLSYFKPVFVSFFIIAFDVYWLLLVFYLGIHLLVSYRRLQQGSAVNWKEKCENLTVTEINNKKVSSYKEVYQLLILPNYQESIEVIRTNLIGVIEDGFPLKQIIVVLAMEGRAGLEAQARAEVIKQEFGHKFGYFLITTHPDNIEGELKGKGANQAWAAQKVKDEIIDKLGFDYDKILVSVFDIDTVVKPGYFHCLTYKFLTVENPYHASYQPVPVYHNNLWQAPFFSRVAASSNTFWQMMQQIRQEKLATYSSHSMAWRTLVDIGFWSTNMVSEDSRVFWHSFLYYKGDYRVEPMYFPVSMDVTMGVSFWDTAKSLYKQQRRWGWGAENVPYIIFNTIKNWDELPKGKILSRVTNQLYGFHSWATNALIIAGIGWLPLLFGGDSFNSTVLSGNLPVVSRTLMMCAMSGLVLSSILSTMLLPRHEKRLGFFKTILMLLQWLILPLSIVIFGAFPALDAQTRLMRGKYLGFYVTPKVR